MARIYVRNMYEISITCMKYSEIVRTEINVNVYSVKLHSTNANDMYGMSCITN